MKPLSEYAKKYLGIPYNEGITKLSEQGFDCFGLIFYSIKDAMEESKDPRLEFLNDPKGLGFSSWAWWFRVLEEVDEKDRKPGDILFIKDAYLGESENVCGENSGAHVAIFQKDINRVIHCIERLGVISSKLDLLRFSKRKIYRFKEVIEV